MMSSGSEGDESFGAGGPAGAGAGTGSAARTGAAEGQRFTSTLPAQTLEASRGLPGELQPKNPLRDIFPNCRQEGECVCIKSIDSFPSSPSYRVP